MDTNILKNEKTVNENENFKNDPQRDILRDDHMIVNNENVIKLLNVILKNSTDKIIINIINKNIDKLKFNKYCDNGLFIKIILTLNKKNKLVLHYYNKLFVLFIKKLQFIINIENDKELNNILDELNDYNDALNGCNKKKKLDNKKLMDINLNNENVKCKYCKK